MIFINKHNGLTLIVCFVCLLLIGCSACIRLSKPQTDNDDEEKTRIANMAIQDDPVLKELDSICATIPQLNGFEFSHKYVGKHRKFASFYYSSSSGEAIDYSSIKNFYFDYFQGHEWELTDDRDLGSKWIEFKKNENFIMISAAPGSGFRCCTFYAVDCAKTSYRK